MRVFRDRSDAIERAVPWRLASSLRRRQVTTLTNTAGQCSNGGTVDDHHKSMSRFVERTLWCDTNDGRTRVSQSALRARTEPLVILGEAGMGKTSLLDWIAEAPGYARCTARRRAKQRCQFEVSVARGSSRPS